MVSCYMVGVEFTPQSATYAYGIHFLRRVLQRVYERETSCRSHAGRHMVSKVTTITTLSDSGLTQFRISTVEAPTQTTSKSSKAASGPPLTFKWEKRKKVGYAPTLRSGCTMANWSAKSMGVLFGGVTDEDTSEETLESIFHNDL